LIRLCLASCLLVLSSLGPAWAWGADGCKPASRQPSEVRLLFGGDVLLSRGVERRLDLTPGALREALRKTLEGADFAAANLEGAVGGRERCGPWVPGKPCFAIPPRFASLLADAGLKAIGTENNHSADLGDEGRAVTFEALARSSILPLTFADSPQFVRFGNFTLGIITFSNLPGRDGRFVPIPSTALRQKLRLAANLANLVVVYVHWGSELLPWPDEKQVQGAKWLVSHGASLIVGCHPHVVQGPEWIDGKPVFFSLGNLVFDQAYAASKTGLLAQCRVSGARCGFSALATHTPDDSFFPEISGHNQAADKVLSGRTINLSRGLVINGISLRPGNDSMIPGRTGGGLAPGEKGAAIEGVRGGKVLWVSRPVKLVSLEPMALQGRAHARLLFALERCYSDFDGVTAVRPYVYEPTTKGLVPVWRGTSLAWPLLDATLLPGNSGILCALHSGGSFLAPGTGSGKRRVAAYRWNGFGFSGVEDKEIQNACRSCLAGG
jgi:hypothetical protein